MNGHDMKKKEGEVLRLLSLSPCLGENVQPVVEEGTKEEGTMSGTLARVHCLCFVLRTHTPSSPDTDPLPLTIFYPKKPKHFFQQLLRHHSASWGTGNPLTVDHAPLLVRVCL